MLSPQRGIAGADEDEENISTMGGADDAGAEADDVMMKD
jgi:hypothetical protein